MSIWKKRPTLDQLNEMNQGTIHDALGIRFSKIGDDYLEATMPVDQRTQQPYGLLHGGASVVLAESLGSVASVLVIGSEDKIGIGIEVNASHLNAAREGTVTGRVTPLRLGHSLHVWEIQIRDTSNINSDPVCQARLTVLIKNLKTR